MARQSIERVEFLAVEGWALGDAGQPAALTLWHGGAPVPAALERVLRPDVQAHCGAGVAADAGFVLRPDGAAWWRRFGLTPQRCVLHLDGVPAAEVEIGLDEPELLAWVDAVAQWPASPQREAEVARLQPFLCGGACSDALVAWARQRLAEPSLPPPDGFRAAIDRVEGLRVIGWVSDTTAAREDFSVHCHGRHWPVRARRVPREDVRQALPGAGPQCGFELDLPAAIWAATGPVGDAWVQLRVNGYALWPRPARIRRAAVAQGLDALLAAAEPAGGTDRVAADASARAWWAVEHVLASGGWVQLPPAARAALRQRFGDEDWDRLRPWWSAGPVDAPPDEPAQALWRLQQAFNDCLAGAPAEPTARGPALRRALEVLRAEQSGLSPAVWQPFLASVVPAFCAAGVLPALRPHLDETHLASLAQREDRWALSLLLPIRLHDELPEGHLTQALALAERLARPQVGGWLNTEAVAAAIDAWRDALAAGTPIDDWQSHAFADALLALWEALAVDPAWSRLHDEQLMRAQWSLLHATRWLDAPQAERVVDAALRHYALVPAFWRLGMAPGVAAGADEPAALAAARERALPVLARLERGLPGAFDDAALDLLAWARERGAVEAAALQRQALPALRAQPPAAEAWCRGLPSEDVLRLRLDGADAEAAWRRIDPLPAPAQAAVRAEAWRALGGLLARGWEADAQRAAWAALERAGSERAGFVGLPWLVHAARAEPPGRPSADAAQVALADAWQRALAALARRADHHPRPPAAVCAAAAALAQWAGQADAPPAVSRLLAEVRAGLAALGGAAWADPAPLPAAPSLAARWPGVGVLLVVRRRVGTGPAALARGLGAGIDLCLWAPGSPAPPAPHIDGVPVLHDATLAGLLATLLSSSDHAQFVLVDDDARPAVDAWVARTGLWRSHYHGWPDDRALSRVRLDADGRPVLDPSPTGTATARIATGLGLSRQAAAWALAAEDDPATPAWATTSPDPEKRLADLLLALGLPLDTSGQAVLQARRPGPDTPAGTPFADRPPPGPGTSTVWVFGDASDAAPAPSPLGPSRLWPTDRPPRLRGADGSQQLVRLHDPFDGRPLAPDEVGVFAVARNERVLMPHFLAHYRALGVHRFTIADNLSCDGTREFLRAQPDVTLYSVDTPYRRSHYGVAWQQAMLAEHALGRWALVVDIDEFLVWPGCERETLAGRCAALEAAGHDAALALMIDMYPAGPLDTADFERAAPFAEAPCFDQRPVRPWRLGSGSYSNSPSWVSAARHRLLPGSPPNHYTAQKVMLVRYQPFVRWSEGLHYAAGVRRAPEPMFLAHFKYHRGFRAKVEEEVARRQHYNDAQEYRKYRALWAEARGIMYDPAVSRRYLDSTSFADIPWN